MSLTNSPFWIGSTGGGFYNHEIDNSIRFAESSYLSRTPGTTGNQKTWTFSAWVKRSRPDTQQNIFNPYTGGDGSNESQFHFKSDGALRFYDSGGLRGNAGTSAKFKDCGTFYHIVLRVDTTQATASNRIRIYVNGEQMDLVNQGYGSTYPSQNAVLGWNKSSNTHYIGTYRASASYYDGYMAEINHVDGQSLGPTEFGETKNGIWIPKEYSGSHGTTGFYLKFNGNANDSSGNSNNFSTSGVQTYDYTPDSPTQNLNQCMKDDDSGPGTLIEGGLRSYITSQGNYYSIATTIGVKNGKWYWESRSIRGGNNSSGLPSQGFMPDGKYCANLSSSAPPGKIAINVGTQDGSDGVYMIAADLDNGYIYRGRNGSWSNGATESGIESGSGTGAVKTLTAAERNQFLRVCVTHRHDTGTSNCLFNFGQDSTLEGYTTAGNNADGNGFGDFKYSPPSGFLSICNRNLPDPGIDPVNEEKPGDYFNTRLYTGNNSNPQSITGVGFKPDWVWIKNRQDTNTHTLYDVVRGVQKTLQSNGTNSETTNSDSLLSFDTDGFSIGAFTSMGNNYSNHKYVSWNWLASNGTSSNTDGSLTSTVSANTKAGFSIVEYTGTGSAETIGHGLDEPPELIILKERNASDNWSVYAEPLGNTYKLRLNGNNSRIGPSNNLWNGTSPTSTVFSIGTDGELNGNVIAYCFHSVDGYCKVGEYTGNSSSDGAVVYTGFKPAFLFWKKYNGSDDWGIHDNIRVDHGTDSNPIEKYLRPNTNASEGDDGPSVDFLSNGFKWRINSGLRNNSGSTYIYMAIAEQPFKYANAK